MTENLAKFGHHPDPGTDFTVEAEALEGIGHDVSVGAEPRVPFLARLDRALSYSPGEDEIAKSAKLALYELRDKHTLGRKPDGERDELAAAASEAYRACISAWSCGEPAHRVKTMLDKVDDLGILLGEPGAGVDRYPTVHATN